MVLGLLSRTELIPLTEFISNYAGDTLWALLIYWLIRIAFPNKNTWHILWLAIAFSFCIEFSQIYHAPWIDDIRSNRLGGLILGFGFKSSDLICYSIGIIFGASIDSMYLRQSKLSILQ